MADESNAPQASNETYFNAYRDNLEKARISSHEQFDKALLTLSSGGLALSLGFVQSYKLRPECPLYLSWGAFAISILATVISLYLAPYAITQMIEYSRKYYLEGDDAFCEKEDCYTWIVKKLNLISVISFSIAIITTIFFIGNNLDSGGFYGR